MCGEWNDPEKMLASFTAPNDPNVAVTVHYYPYQFASNSWNMPVWNTPENKASVAGIFKQLHDKYVAKGIPVILGEYAMMSDIVYWPEARFFMDNVNKEAYKNGITTMFWDDGWNSGFDRVNLKMKPDNYIKYILNAAQGIPNSFVWPGEFYIREGSPVTDITAALDLYGNTLTDVYNGTARLTRGMDYTVSGTTFTLKASYLNKILDASKLGQQAVLTFKFSQGADNEVNVIRYKPATVQPLLINKSQPFTGDLVVPFNYNGMKIKHAWAVDETGQPVDKVNNWTKYLEWGGDYTYDNKSTVTFRKDFANMFDRNATVTFEMWPSGT
ncbi:X2-like carbohydrate binding domain-containing protein [Paenibacillus sambharensis]|nr:X2-like carbohydrate binding domain-containing protein [Paenibacillus sambharensis]